MIKFASLGSGSKGNATLVKCNSTYVLVDCGFTLKETQIRLERLGVSPRQLSAVLITHEHSDHIQGAGPLARRFQVPVYSTYGTKISGRFNGEIPDWRPVTPERPFAVQDLEITPVTVPHDAREPVQFILGNGAKRLGVLTDLGQSTPHLISHYQRCQALILEANHCPNLLAQGPYPPSLKRRVGGNYGHLSNQQAANLLSELVSKRSTSQQLQHLIASHLSDQNNQPHLAQQLLADSLNTTPDWIGLNDQEEGMGWRSL